MKNNLIDIKSIDGFSVETMISAPDKQPNGVVIYVNSSGPNTYNIKRKNPDGQVWYYHDVFANELTDRGLVYCRYSARGVIDGDKEPYFVEIDDKKYSTYLPHNSVNDVLAIIDYVAKIHDKFMVYKKLDGKIIEQMPLSNLLSKHSEKW